MLNVRAAVCVSLLSSAAGAQLIAPRVVSAPSAAAAPAAISASAAAAAPLPALAPSPLFAAASSIAAAPAPAAAAALAPVAQCAAAPAFGALAAAADGPKARKDGLLGSDGEDASAMFDGKAPAASNSEEAAAPRRLWKKVEVLDLHPTQANVGKIEVKKKAAKLEGMNREDAKAKLKSESWLIPVVVGPPKQPGGPERLYPNDHHHESAAALKAGFKHVYVTKVADLSHLSEKEFWAEMIKRQWVYLRSLGKPIDPAGLPRDVAGLGDDVFRSVAGEVRDAGGYEKNLKPFSEFLWADFFRSRLKTDPEKDFKKAVAEAVALARSAAARDLPGWIGAGR